MRRAPFSNRTIRGGLVVMSVLLASCGGDSPSALESAASSDDTASTDAPAAATTDVSAPDTTAAPTSTVAPTPDTTVAPDTSVAPATDALVLAGGLISLEPPDGWEVVASQAELPPMVVTRNERRDWELDENLVGEIAELEADGFRVLVGREPRFNTADFDTWRAALRTAVLDGNTPNVMMSSTYEWAGGTGTRTRASVSGVSLQFDNVQAGTQLIVVLTIAQAALGAEQLAEIDGLLDSIVVDDSVLPILQHSLDARSSAPNAGGTTLTTTFLAPLSWQLVSEGPVIYEAPDGGFVSFEYSEPLAGFTAESYLAELGADEFFELPVTSISDSVDDVPFWVLFEGSPDAAVAAMVFAEHGSLLVTCRLYTPGNHELLVEMLDTLRFLNS
jgi:hypothetical protein